MSHQQQQQQQQQQGDLTRHPIPQMVASASADDNDIKLKVPSDPLSNSRPESPVNRKRTDDDSASGQGHRHQDGSTSSNTLHPTKKSKTSPPLVPTINNHANNNNNNNGNNLHLNSGNNNGHTLSDYRTSPDDALSPQTSPILEPLMPVHVVSMTEKRYSPVADVPVQSKARKLDEGQPLSPSFRPTSPSFHVGSPPFRATSPSFGGSATAILESLSKPGENSLGNLNLGTPIIGRTPVGERVMGVITSQPNSRQSSPDPRPMSGITECKRGPLTSAISASGVAEALESRARAGQVGESDLNDAAFSLNTVPDANEPSNLGEPSPSETMPTCSEKGDDDDDDEGEDDEDDDPLASAEEPMHPTEETYGYDSDDDHEPFGPDSMDEIDVEGMEMLDSDSDTEGTPYQDPDPMCLDRFSEEESDMILEEARMHGKHRLCSSQVEIPDSVTENDLIRTISERLKKMLRRRKRLQQFHSLDHVVSLLKNSKQIMVLTGAGVSVSCGIPDFRSEDGIYSRLSEFELDDPQQMFDLDFFRERPQIFYSFAREIFPSNFTPSPSHYFIKLLESQDKLLRNYTQNIDTLEQKAGIQKVLQCHGSFATASCVRCGYQVPGDEIKDQIFKQEVAYCKACKTPSPPPKSKAKKRSGYHSSDDDDDDDDDDESTKALMKPDIVFFGEKLPAVFHQSLKEDREKVDLLIVIGSSLKVAPVSDIMHQLPNSVPQILINRTPNHQMEFDVQLLGNCDAIVAELCRMVGWELKHAKLPGGTSNVPEMETYTNEDGSGAGGRAAWTFVEPNTYLFEGADLEEINFEAIQERNRRRIHRDGGGRTVPGEEGDDDDDDDDEDEDEEEEYGGGDDVEGMEGLTTESSHRRLATHGTWLGRDDDESEHGITHDSTHVTGSSLVGSRHHSIAGFATGTTEPRSGSITDIHQDILTAAAEVAAAQASLRSPTFASDSHFPSHRVHHDIDGNIIDDGNDEDEEGDEEAKIRVMFTEKMPKDLGEDDIDIVGYSRRPSEDLGPITEDIQEVDVEDNTDDDDDEVDIGVDDNGHSGGIGSAQDLNKETKLEGHS
ncbi:NAD-dependent histone deacetylase sir2 [Mortierella sp. AD011]|nr:NAD-dependent histone deacetylase sir2 [Mortierella sp. AD010]KAF9390843.1 NAD-dependent histone deacetylase sir2 [Mortierella sp. AD011]